MMLERVPPSTRGELTRWMLELRAGVFVGKVSAAVRDRLWARVCSRMKGGSGILVYSTNSEQGFAVHFWGRAGRRIENHDGLWLVRLLE